MAITEITIDGTRYEVRAIPNMPIEENKSNDSFQWTDEDSRKFKIFVELKCGETNILNPSLPLIYEWMNEYNQSHTPKPQAENKPDWEIVQMNDVTGGRVHAYNVDGCKYNKCTIHSVKRLSDNQVFSVGDEAKDGVRWNAEYSKIKLFEVHGSDMAVTLEDGSFILDIKYAKKLPPQPQKLFTTEDGKDIFSGDRYWFINDNNTIALPNMAHEAISFPKKCKRFSTKEAAEEYIADNKPEWAGEKGKEKRNLPEYPIAPQPQKEEQEALRFKYDVTLKDADAFLKANNLYTQQQVDAMCEDAALKFMHYTEHIMDDDDWMDGDGLKSMKQVYKEFTQYKNSKE